TGGVVVNTGSTLLPLFAVAYPNPLTLNGTGYVANNYSGALSALNQQAVNQSPTRSGNIVLNQGATIGASAGVNLTIHGIISGNSTIQTTSGAFGATTLLTLPSVQLIAGNLVRNVGATANFIGVQSGVASGNLDTNINRITILGATAASLGLIGNNAGVLNG